MSLQGLVAQCFSEEEIDGAIAESVAVRAGLMAKAEEVKEFWQDYWMAFDHPHSREHTLKSGYVERPGDYEKSIRVKFLPATETGFMKARVQAYDYKAHWIEYGCIHMPEFAPRAATLEHFGGGSTVSA